MGYDERNFLGGLKIIFGHRRRINWRSLFQLSLSIAYLPNLAVLEIH